MKPPNAVAAGLAVAVLAGALLAAVGPAAQAANIQEVARDEVAATVSSSGFHSKDESSLGVPASEGGVDSNTLLKRFLRGFMGRQAALQAPLLTCSSGPVSSQTGEGPLFSQGPPNCRNRPLC